MTSLNLKLRALRVCEFYIGSDKTAEVHHIDTYPLGKHKRDLRLADKLSARIEKDFEKEKYKAYIIDTQGLVLREHPSKWMTKELKRGSGNYTDYIPHTFWTGQLFKSKDEK